MPPPQRRTSQSLNVWTGRIIPLLLLGVIGYVIYIITKTIGIDFCITPAFQHDPVRRSSGIAIITIQFILLFPLAFAWIRFFVALVHNVGYIPLGTPPPVRSRSRSGSRSKSGRRRRSSSTTEKAQPLDRFAVREGSAECPPGLEHFYNKEVFMVASDGVPRFCNSCWNWKPDRSHHCGELGRCIRKFDHFCPWVGGAVTETNNKFFIQFTFYATLYCTFVLAVCIWAIVQGNLDCKHSTTCSGGGGGVQDNNWIGGIILSAIFGLMSVSIVGRFGYFVLVNETTIEDLSMGSPNYSIAVRINSSELPRSTDSSSGSNRPSFWVVPYPFRPRVGAEIDAPTGKNEHLYAILQPNPGHNVWNLGPMRNWRNIMGNSWWDWFVPLRTSPCATHDSIESDFLLGPDFEDLERAYLPHRYDSRGRRKLPLRS